MNASGRRMVTITSTLVRSALNDGRRVRSASHRCTGKKAIDRIEDHAMTPANG